MLKVYLNSIKSTMLGGKAKETWERVEMLGLEANMLDVILCQFPNGITFTELSDVIAYDLTDTIDEIENNL